MSPFEPVCCSVVVLLTWREKRKEGLEEIALSAVVLMELSKAKMN